MRQWSIALAAIALLHAPLSAQRTFTHADTLRGSITAERAWWDVSFYDLNVRVDPADSTIRGWNAITYTRTSAPRDLQIDLQQPLEIDSVLQNGERLRFRRDGNAFFVTPAAAHRDDAVQTVTVHYHGSPRVAVRAPWDGGIVWARDSLGGHWIASANQGLGASVWWPNKDTQADEPDSQRIAITVPDSIADVSNGRLRAVEHHADGTATWVWFVRSPINNYGVAINAADYAHFGGVYYGEGGPLTTDFWPLAYHLDAARAQFAQVPEMLKCFEHWFGPYPWYEDGYKLVETPHLGMEHQSAVAYGNHYLNGYLGNDLSGTGRGADWDFIIVHESAHEWWGNNITSADLADMWVHESFANYAESLFVECRSGKAAGAEYVIGTRARIENDAPIIPPYGVNAEGSGDMYYKGGNMLHTIRQIVGDDEKWRGILRGLNRTFRHQVVTAAQVEDYISRNAGTDLTRVFQQYLTTTDIPVLQYRRSGGRLSYRWTNSVSGFDMPVRVRIDRGEWIVLRPTTEWQTLRGAAGGEVEVDPNYYVGLASAR